MLYVLAWGNYTLCHFLSLSFHKYNIKDLSNLIYHSHIFHFTNNTIFIYIFSFFVFSFTPLIRFVLSHLTPLTLLSLMPSLSSFSLLPLASTIGSTNKMALEREHNDDVDELDLKVAIRCFATQTQHNVSSLLCKAHSPIHKPKPLKVVTHLVSGELKYPSFQLSWRKENMLRTSKRSFLSPLLILIVKRMLPLKTNKELMRSSLVHFKLSSIVLSSFHQLS